MKKYVAPEMEVILFESQDVIVTSGGGNGPAGGGDIDDM